MLAAAWLQRARTVLQTGGLIGYPTEGVYGLGCDPGDEAAVRRLCTLKQRPLSAGLILIAADARQLAGYIAPNERELARLLAAAGERAITWLIGAGPLTAPWITGGRDQVAVRITTHPMAAALCVAAGMPLVSTSANRRGRPPARSLLQLRRWFGAELDLILPGPTGAAAGPSEIRDAMTGRVLRPGAAG